MAEKRFGDRTFMVEKVLAKKGLVLQARLFRVIGPAVEKLPSIIAAHVAPNATEESKNAANIKALQAVADIFEKTEPDALADLVDDLISTALIQETSKSWTRADLDRDFSDENSGDLFPALVWILQEQFSDFFSGALATGRQKTAARD